MQKIRIVLPAYNEELSLPSLLKRIDQVHGYFGLNMEVLVVNDGSKDKTPDIAREYKGNIQVKLLDLNPNRGLAGAMRAGLTEGIKDLKDDDIVITMDADDSHHPGLIRRMVSQIHEGSDIVIASRYREGASIKGLSFFRKFMSWGAGILFRIIAHVEGVRDYTCGYRAYRVDLLRKAHEKYGDKFIQQQGFSCMSEILLKLSTLKPVINELPMILRYDFKMSDSKMNIFKTIRQTLNMLFTFALINRNK
ncbi:MAG: glycosyltransferase family 2 protein [Bacteroidales bacterium]